MMASIALTALLLLSSKAELLLSNDFEGGKVVGWRLRGDVAKLTSDPKEVISGRFSLKASTEGFERGLYFEFAWCDPKEFKIPTPGRFKLTFDYRVLKCAPQGGLYFDVRGEIRKKPIWISGEQRQGHAEAEFWLPPGRRYQLLFGIKYPGSIFVLDNIRLYRILLERPTPLKAPEPLAPLPNQELTDVAFSFGWLNVDGAFGYELEVARKPDFSGAKRFVIPRGEGRHTVFTPKEIPKPGKYFWRVRAIGEAGERGPWSESFPFTVNSDHPRKRPQREISSERPLFYHFDGYGDSPDDLLGKWEAIPDDLKPYCAIGAAYEPVKGFPVLRELARRSSGFPLFIHIIAATGRAGRREWPLSLVEWCFQKFPWVLGWSTSELWGCGEDLRDYVERATVLAAKYGKWALWIQCNSIEGYQFLTWGKRRDWWRFICEHGDIFVPVCKFVGPAVALGLHSTVLGWWLCGAVERFGVQVEPYYWGVMGEPELSEPPFQRKRKYPVPERETYDLLCRRCPSAFLALGMLLGLSSGATVYGTEPCMVMWEWERRAGKWALSRIAREAIVPLMRAIVREGLIPSKEEVLREVRLGYLASEADRHRAGYDDPMGRLGTLLCAVYGLDPSFWGYDLIPKRFDFFFVPIFPELCPKERIPKSIRLIPSEEFKERKLEEFERFLRPYARKFGEGKAFVCKVGRTLVVMNSKENERERQRFRIRLEGPILEAWGEVGLHSYLVAKIGGERVFLHFGGRREERTKLSLRCRRKPSIKAEPLEGLRNVKWEEGVLSVEVDHSRGAVEVWLEFGE